MLEGWFARFRGPDWGKKRTKKDRGGTIVPDADPLPSGSNSNPIEFMSDGTAVAVADLDGCARWKRRTTLSPPRSGISAEISAEYHHQFLTSSKPLREVWWRGGNNHGARTRLEVLNVANDGLCGRRTANVTD